MLRKSLRDILDRFAATTGWNLIHKTPRFLWSYPDSELTVTLDMVLSHFRQQHANPFCLQIGAFDGVAGDPIYPLIEKHALHGVLVEPLKDAFERLQANYAKFGGRFTLINAAVGPVDGKRTFYRIRKEATGPDWIPQLASFDKDVVLKHRRSVPNIESLLVVEDVPCMTFSTLLATTQAGQIDVLQIDSEGYDAEILRQFDLRRREPAIVHFEHKHLSQRDHEQCIRELIELGYKLTLSRENTLAYMIR